MTAPKRGFTSRAALVAELRIDAASAGLDLDDLWWVVVAIILSLGGFVAVLYVVYAAPVLLAEGALDAALVSTVYRRLRREDAGYWAGAVLRRTWLPAVVLIVFVTLLGVVLQRAVPGARSIGDVLRSVGG